MYKSILLLFILLFLCNCANAQRKTLPVGSQIIVKEIASWDPQFVNKDKIINKAAVVSKRPLLFSADDHYSGFITVDGIEYRILDMRIKVITGEEPVKKTEPKNVLKLKNQLIELARLSSQDFDSIKSTFPKSFAGITGPSYLANYFLQGSIDSSTIIYFDDMVKRWNLRTLMNTDQFSSAGLDYIFRTLKFPFGKLEPMPGQEKIIDSSSYSIYYVPADRMNLKNSYRYFTVLLDVESFKGKGYFISIKLMNKSLEPALLSEQINIPEPGNTKNTKKFTDNILYLVKIYKNEFKEIKTSQLISDAYWKDTYVANYHMEGSTTDGTSVYFDTTSKKWQFSAFIDPKIYSEKEVDSLIMSIDYPFGKLEKTTSEASPEQVIYAPINPELVPSPYKGIRLSVHKFYLNSKLYSQLFSIIKFIY